MLVDDDFPDVKCTYSQVTPRKAYATMTHGGRTVYVHRWLMGLPEGKEVDHINGDSLDNRKDNLRACSKAENRRNLGISIRNNSGYKGIWFDKSRNKYQVRVGHKFVGRYSLLVDAISAYNEVAKDTFGVFAKINNVQKE